MENPEKIAVFLPSWAGDVVMATPTLRALRRHFGLAGITYVGRKIALDVLSGTDLADEMLVDISRRRPRALSFLALAGRLRKRHFDLAILLPNSFRTAALASLAGTTRRAGYDRDGRGWLLTEKLKPKRDERGEFLPVPTIDYYIELVKMLGVVCESRRMELPVTDADQAAADALLNEAGIDRVRPIVILNPGGSFGPSKLWMPDRFAAVADALVERRDAAIIINAAPAEREIASQVAATMRHKPAINFAEHRGTIRLLKGLMRRCALLITNDTGARHLAAALGAAVVTVFGSTDPQWAQIDYDKERIVRVDVPCSPCQSKLCRQPPGPTYHQCMTAITPDMVLAAAEELLP
ncbi:MAG: lipopolysaccharide heptosyltransferase II [Phycisphaerae bacterium]|nr:lipopolysaccharide heptosyltransferase II [Phycisphaerae bacterium]